MVIRIKRKTRIETEIILLLIEKIMTTVRKVSKKKRIVIFFPHHLGLLETLLSSSNLLGLEEEAINLRRRG